MSTAVVALEAEGSRRFFAKQQQRISDLQLLPLEHVVYYARRLRFLLCVRQYLIHSRFKDVLIRLKQCIKH